MALLACLDVVVTVDTSVGHLAAAIVRPVWILLATSPDWRWLLEREVRSVAALGGGEWFSIRQLTPHRFVRGGLPPGSANIPERAVGFRGGAGAGGADIG